MNMGMGFTAQGAHDIDHGGAWKPVPMHRGEANEVFTEVYYSDHVGEGDMLSVRRYTPAAAGKASGEQTWHACIWHGHEDCAKHYCQGWCDREYATMADALIALAGEYRRRRPSTPPLLLLPTVD